MILVDTSVWLDHLHDSDPDLVQLLEQSAVVTHPMVIGEIALRATNDRDLVLDLLGNLPAVTTATHEEVLSFVTNAPLYGLGLSLVDAHLLASARLESECLLWTRDTRLAAAAHAMTIGWMPASVGE